MRTRRGTVGSGRAALESQPLLLSCWVTAAAGVRPESEGTSSQEGACCAECSEWGCLRW